MEQDTPRTLFEKIWARHQILEREDGQTLLFADRHFVHDGSARAFEVLRERNLPLRAPERTFATADHYVPTDSRDAADISDPERRLMVDQLTVNAAANGVQLFGLGDARQGIVHVMGPEEGLSLPGMLIVCGDSHTSTHGALGALAFGIGSTEVSHVLATQSLWQRKPKTLRVTVTGTLSSYVSGKDVILAIIAAIGVAGATGHVIEYAGPAIESLSIEGRLTLCNMSIEAGARAGMVAPDDQTFAYLHGKPYAPQGREWEASVARWRTLRSDPGAVFDQEIELDGAAIAPMVTWGNSPEDAMPITGTVPDPSHAIEAERQAVIARTLDYMGLTAGMPLTHIVVDQVFIGSCTNGRIEDMRSAAQVARGRHVAPGVRAWAVPGSGLVRAQAEAEGLHEIFRAAGFEWREAGCSMCIAVNGDMLAPGQRSASTSNRNFVGRQGPGARTHLMSPAMAAAAAVNGRLADVRTLPEVV